MRTEPTSLTEELERIVDRVGMQEVMVALELVCIEKAAWVNSAESIGKPDKKLAKLWDKCGKACYKVAVIAQYLP